MWSFAMLLGCLLYYYCRMTRTRTHLSVCQSRHVNISGNVAWNIIHSIGLCVRFIVVLSHLFMLLVISHCFLLNTVVALLRIVTVSDLFLQ